MQKKFDDQVSENNSEFTGYDLKGPSLSDIPNLKEINPFQIETLRIMHSPNIKSMKGIHQFIKLQEINLSSNNIEQIESLEKLTELKILDLSCNKIRVINGIGGLLKLEKLILSHNKILNIQNLKNLSGEDYNLKYLDLSDNRIQDYKELLVINSLFQLETLFLEQGKNSNPICKKRKYYYEVLQNLKNFKQFKLVDGVHPDTLLTQAFPEKPDEKKENIREKASPIKQQKILSSPFDHTKLKYKNLQRSIEKEKEFFLNENENPNCLSDDRFNTKELEYKTEICSMKDKLEDMIFDQKNLIYKYEMSEKFWGGKCEKMEKELIELNTLTKTQKKDIKRLTVDNTNLKNELDLCKKDNKDYIIKKDRKDEMVENLHQRISSLLKENGESHKEIVLKTEEINHLKQNLKSNEDLIKDLKASLRENEKILSTFHSKSLENASFTLQRGEEMKRKFESIYDENKLLLSENSDLKQKNLSLMDLTKEWEFKYESKINEIKYEFEREMKNTIDSYEKQMFQLEHQLNHTRKEQDADFKKSLDLLEEEFKKVLNENNEKFRGLRIAYEEKNKNESDLKDLLKAALMKNNEQESTINEFERNLNKIKKEVVEIIADRDLLQKEVNVKKNIKEKEFDLHQEEKETLQKEKMVLESNFMKLKEMRSHDLIELNSLRNKMLFVENITNEIDDLKTHIETKTRILEDKNDTIESLKEENEGLKQNYSGLNEDFVKLSKKFEKQTEIIEELERQNLFLKEENEDFKKELKEKKNLIKIFEGEIENIKQTQENEIEALKESSKKKDEKINEILKNLAELKFNLQQNNEKLKEREKVINEMELQSLYRENELKNKMNKKDKEIEILKSKLEENEDEMKILIVEIEKQKRLAKENIEKLNKIFNM